MPGPKSSLIGGTRPFTSGFEPQDTEGDSQIFVPFVAYIRLVPMHRVTPPSTGRRFETVRNLEKLAWRIEERLLETPAFNIATPVAVKPQIGDYPALVTVVGFNKLDQLTTPRFNVSPVTTINKIHTSADPGAKTTLFAGSENDLAEGEDTTVALNAEVKALRLALFTRLTAAPVSPVQKESALINTIRDIYAMEYNGIKFGVKKQGSRSFPL